MRRRMITGLLVLILVGAALILYVRVVPLEAARWHRPIEAASDQDLTGGAIRVLDGDAALFGRLDNALGALPRTKVLAGSVAENRITYVTRSAFFGFPDITTIELRDGQIRMFARLKFGASDLGVNRKRLEGLIAAVQ